MLSFTTSQSIKTLLLFRKEPCGLPACFSSSENHQCSNLSTKYTFEDTLAKAKYNKDAAICFYDNETDAQQNNIANAVAKWEQGSERFSASYTETDALSTATIKEND